MKDTIPNYIKILNETIHQSICLIKLIANDPKTLIRFLVQRTQESSEKYRPSVSSKTWDIYQKNIMDEIGFPISINFLQKDSIRQSMFVSGGLEWQQTQLKYLESRFDENFLGRALKENIIGLPRITSDKYLTSHNSIHHLYHWALFFDKTQLKPEAITFIVEWGGGYGNMAKIFRRLNPSSTYVILDLPIMTYLQSIYLQSILGKDDVLVNPKIIGRGKINLFSTANFKMLAKQLTDDLQKKTFISMWALSESDLESVSFVKKTNYFGADYIFLGYQKASIDHPNSEKILPATGFKTIFSQEITFLKKNYYLVSKKNA